MAADNFDAWIPTSYGRKAVAKPSKGTPADKRLKANNPNAGKSAAPAKPVKATPASTGEKPMKQHPALKQMAKGAGKTGRKK